MKYANAPPKCLFHTNAKHGIDRNNNPISRFKFIGCTAKSISIVAQKTTTNLNPQNNIPKNDIK